MEKSIQQQNQFEEYAHCLLCPRQCAVDRLAKKTGVCGQTDEIKIARAALHMWEEPCISGSRGSGAVFFSGCALHCVFCQNANIANGDTGKVISMERLAEIFLELQEQGANNINLVTAGQFVPGIKAALELAKGKGLILPIVYNSSAYESVETIRSLDGYVDVYLPDLKYMDTTISEKYSHAPDYFVRASAAIEEMVRQTGTLCFIDEQTKSSQLNVAEYQLRSEAGEHLLMTKGVIVRHLLLPGCTSDSKAVIRYLIKTYGEQIFISIMNQYTPMPRMCAFPELDRKVSEAEYEAVIDDAIAHGIENGFIQEGDVAKESFIPDFDGTGV